MGSVSRSNEGRRFSKYSRLTSLQSGEVGLDRVVLVELCLDIIVYVHKLLKARVSSG